MPTERNLIHYRILYFYGLFKSLLHALAPDRLKIKTK